MLLLVIEKMTTKYPIIMSALPVLTDAQKELEEQCAVLLNNYGHICEQEKVLISKKAYGTLLLNLIHFLGAPFQIVVLCE